MANLESFANTKSITVSPVLFLFPKSILHGTSQCTFLFSNIYSFKSYPKKTFPVGHIFQTNSSNKSRNCLLISLFKTTYEACTLIICTIVLYSTILVFEIQISIILTFTILIVFTLDLALLPFLACTYNTL